MQLPGTRKRQRDSSDKGGDTDFGKFLFLFKKNIKKGTYTNCVEFLRGYTLTKGITRELNEVFKTIPYCLTGSDASIALKVVMSRDEAFQQSISSRSYVKQQMGGAVNEGIVSSTANLNNFFDSVASSVGITEHKNYHLFIEMIKSVWKCFAGVKHATEANGASGDKISMSFSVERIFSDELFAFMETASKFEFEISIGKANTLLMEIIYKY